MATVSEDPVSGATCWGHGVPVGRRRGGERVGCHAERSAALQVTRAPGRTTERGTCWTEAVLEGVHSL